MFQKIFTVTTELLHALKEIDMSILRYFYSGDTSSAIIVLISRLFVLFCCMPIHETAHAYAAYKCGDDTAKLNKRLTINPFAHLDLIGAAMILLFGIGYANPVPVNPSRLRHPRRDMALVALAGPLSNILLSFVFVFVSYMLPAISPSNTVIAVLGLFFRMAAQINISLAVFNLLPVPPLDGAKIFSSVLPDKIYFKLMQYDRYIMIGFMILLFTGIFSAPISWLSGLLMNLISYIPYHIFG